MTLIVGITMEKNNLVFSDTALSNRQGLHLDLASKVGRLNAKVIYGISGDVDSSYRYLDKLRNILSSAPPVDHADYLKRIKYSLIDYSSYSDFVIVLCSAYFDTNMLIVSSDGLIDERPHNSCVAFGSGKQVVMPTLTESIKGMAANSFSPRQIGVATVSLLNQWTIGHKTDEAYSSGFGGTILYLHQTCEELQFGGPLINFRMWASKDTLLVSASGFVFYKGGAVLFNSGTSERLMLLSNLDFDFKDVLTEYNFHVPRFTKRMKKVFEDTSFESFTAISTDGKLIMHGPLKPPIRFKDGTFTVTNELWQFAEDVRIKMNLRELRFII